MSDYYDLSNRIEKVIPYIVDKKIAIYPCGAIGETVKSYLTENHNLSVSLMVDNHKALNCAGYITTGRLQGMDCNEYAFLIASDSKKYYKEIRKEIRRYVSDRNIIDLFPTLPRTKWTDKILWEKLLYPYGKTRFLKNVKNSVNTRVLDVGCGNKSPQSVKMICDKVYYVGIDVGDYNQSEESLQYADEYHVVKSAEFAAEIEKYKAVFDVVISCHNIEHCDEPDRVVAAMAEALKKGGKLYMAFPSEESVRFPRGRNGCLNFYDDATHQKVPDWNKIHTILKEHGMKIYVEKKNNRPYLLRKLGALNEAKSKELKTVLEGTWEYYGFESIIWGKRK